MTEKVKKKKKKKTGYIILLFACPAREGRICTGTDIIIYVVLYYMVASVRNGTTMVQWRWSTTTVSHKRVSICVCACVCVRVCACVQYTIFIEMNGISAHCTHGRRDTYRRKDLYNLARSAVHLVRLRIYKNKMCIHIYIYSI